MRTDFTPPKTSGSKKKTPKNSRKAAIGDGTPAVEIRAPKTGTPNVSMAYRTPSRGTTTAAQFANIFDFLGARGTQPSGPVVGDAAAMYNSRGVRPDLTRQATSLPAPKLKKTKYYDPSKSEYGGGNINLDALNHLAQQANDAPGGANHPTANVEPSLSDQLLQQIMAEAQGGLQSSSGTFSGKLADYISQAEGMIPKVSYDPAVKAVKQNAALGDTRITDGYHALASYFAGLQPQIQQQTADYGSNIKGADNAAAALLNAAYASSAKDAATSAQTGTANEGVGLQAAQAISNQQHQATSGSLAQGLQNALTMSNNQGSIQQDLARQQGGAAQLQGMEAKDAIQKALVNQLAQYATLQAQANQQGALQALQLGQGQFNADRSYYEQQAARADTTSNNAWNRLLQEYQIASSADPNSQANKAAAAKIQAEQAAAQAIQDEKSGVSLSGQRTSFINAYLAKFGTLPTAAQIKAAGF